MIKIEWFFWLCAAFFLMTAYIRLTDKSDPRRLGSAAFWAVLGFTFAYGGQVKPNHASAIIEGVAVLLLVVLAGLGFPKKGTERTTSDAERVERSNRIGPKLFIPALVIPLVAVVFGSVLKDVKSGNQPLLEVGKETLIGLGVASIIALIVGMLMLHEHRPMVPLREGERLLGHIGWAAILPQFLATLGLLFNSAGVGNAVRDVFHKILPDNSVIIAVILYCVGMAVFTMIMGNAFAAFPVMTAAVGWPVLIQQFHGNIPAVFAVGMLAGFCGTLVTPMAANFNLVPAALLELKDQYGPIKAQAPTAAILLVCNIVIMYVFCIPR
ncbi:DUF979 domain-containing protein [Calidifontibacter terrae]